MAGRGQVRPDLVPLAAGDRRPDQGAAGSGAKVVKASTQPARPAGKPPSIEDKTANMKKLDGELVLLTEKGKSAAKDLKLIFRRWSTKI
mgnify:CR=1 FL=1